jgi:hypothetical protein
MDEWWNVAQKASALADLGPLPEVVESNSETVWQTFMQLQAHEKAAFSKTVPSMIGDLSESREHAGQAFTVDDVMAEVRRFNRICPSEPHWSRLCSILHEAVGLEPPAAISGAAARSTPKLTKRIRVRDQVEWAAQNGALQLIAAFVCALPEDQWVHMGQ